MDYIALGHRIRTQRLRLGITQEKLAERVNLSESFLGHIERGSRKPSPESIIKIASELKVSTDFLLLDSVTQEPKIEISEILSILNNKDKQQIQTFTNLIKLLADNIDKWTH